MHRLPMAALFVTLWMALGTDSLQAQAALHCDYGRTYPHANGEIKGDQYLIAGDDNLTRIAERFCVTKGELMEANDIVDEHATIFAGDYFTIPSIGPQRSAGCTSSYLTIYASQPDPRIPQIAVSGSGCWLSGNTVDIWRQSGYSPWSHSQHDSVPLIPTSGGEVRYSARLDASSEQGQMMRIFARVGQKDSDTIPIHVNTAVIPGPQLTCTATDVQISSPTVIPQGAGAFSFTVTAEPNCTMMVSITHSQQGKIKEQTFETGSHRTWRVSATLAANSYLGDTVTINARILQTGVARSVQVPITGSSTAREVRNFDEHECQIYPRDSSATVFAYPGGPSMGSVAGLQWYPSLRVAIRNGEKWFTIQQDGRKSDDWIRGYDKTKGLNVETHGTCDP